MKRPQLIILIFLVAILVVLLFVSNNYSLSTLKAIDRAGIKYSEIIYKKEVKNGEIVFYLNEEGAGLGIGYIEKKFLGWSWVSDGGFLNLGLDKSWHYTNRKIGKINYPICYGVISNNNIKDIPVNILDVKSSKFIISDLKAETINTNGQKKIWYVLFQNQDYQFQTAEVALIDSGVVKINVYVKN